jgi:hypothetical protein
MKKAEINAPITLEKIEEKTIVNLKKNGDQKPFQKTGRLRKAK